MLTNESQSPSSMFYGDSPPSLSIQMKGEQGSLHDHSSPSKAAWICCSAFSLSEFWYKSTGLNYLFSTQIIHPAKVSIRKKLQAIKKKKSIHLDITSFAKYFSRCLIKIIIFNHCDKLSNFFVSMRNLRFWEFKWLCEGHAISNITEQLSPHPIIFLLWHVVCVTRC